MAARGAGGLDRPIQMHSAGVSHTLLGNSVTCPRVHARPRYWKGVGILGTRSAGRPRDLLLPSKPSRCETKSSNLALSVKSAIVSVSFRRHTFRMPPGESWAVLDDVSKTPHDPRLVHWLRVSDRHINVVREVKYCGSLVVRTDDVEVALGEHLVDHVLDSLLGRPSP
jgi:hypothetical protein